MKNQEKINPTKAVKNKTKDHNQSLCGKRDQKEYHLLTRKYMKQATLNKILY